jgi:outer membrane protein
MDTTRRHLFACVALLAGSGTATANDLLRLYELALTRDATLQNAAAQRDAAVESRPQAWAQMLPQIVADASAGRSRVGFESFTQVGGAAEDCDTGSRLRECRGDTSGYQVTLSQSVWNLEFFNRLRQANRQAASAEADLMGAQQSLLLRTAEAYFGVLAAGDQLTTARSERDAFRTLLSQAQGREQTGVGPRSAVAQVQSFFDATEARVIDAQNARDDAKLALMQIVDEHVDDVAALRDDIPLEPPDPASVDDWVRAAQTDNPTVRAAELLIEAADYQTAAELGRGLPAVSLSSSSSKSWQAVPLGGDQSAESVGLSFSVPLFQGGAVASRMRESRAAYRQAQANYESVVRDTESRTRAAYRGVVTGIERIAAARRAVQSARAAVEASHNNVEFGTGTEFDLLNAQNNYSNALRVFSQSRYDYLRNVLTLKRQAGRLTREDLVAIDQLLVSR